MTTIDAEKDREDYIHGKALAKKIINEKRKEIRQTFKASTVTILGLLNTVFFVSTYLLDLLN
jgi:hypothetical protein